MNIALRVFWSNQPLPIHDKIQRPDMVLSVPFGTVLVLENVGKVKSVNGKQGDVVLNAIDVDADSVGAAKNVFDELFPKIDSAQHLAEINQLNITTKVDQVDFEQTQVQVESNRLALLNKADLTALAMLTALVNTKADQVYVQEQIANLVNGDQSILQAIQEISSALQESEDLLDALDYTVANRVRFDIATQTLTALQKHNARTNIGAEEVGTAALLVAQITTQSIGAATALQGKKADTALQSVDVAPVAMTGLFSSLAGQNKIFDIVYSTYVDGTNSFISPNDTLGQMFGKLQAQVKANASPKTEWVSISQIGTLLDASAGNRAFIEEYFIDGVGGIQFAIISNMLYVRAMFKVVSFINGSAPRMITINDAKYFAKTLTNNHIVIRASAFPMITTAGTGLDQLVFRFIKSTDGKLFQFISQQSLNVGEVYCIPTVAIGFVN